MKVNIDPVVYARIKQIVTREVGKEATKREVQEKINGILLYRVQSYPARW